MWQSRVSEAFDKAGHGCAASTLWVEEDEDDEVVVAGLVVIGRLARRPYIKTPKELFVTLLGSGVLPTHPCEGRSAWEALRRVCLDGERPWAEDLKSAMDLFCVAQHKERGHEMANVVVSKVRLRSNV